MRHPDGVEDFNALDLGHVTPSFLALPSGRPRLRARGHPGADVTGLRIVVLVVASMDGLLCPVLKFQH